MDGVKHDIDGVNHDKDEANRIKQSNTLQSSQVKYSLIQMEKL